MRIDCPRLLLPSLLPSARGARAVMAKNASCSLVSQR